LLTHLYRFRSASPVLGKYAEIGKQEIYFSPPEELYDPMEGYKGAFWSGDRNCLVEVLLGRLYSLNGSIQITR
jgi:hypothetical protein